MRLMQQTELPVAAVAASVDVGQSKDNIDEHVEQRVVVSDSTRAIPTNINDRSAINTSGIPAVDAPTPPGVQSISEPADATVTLERQNISTSEQSVQIDALSTIPDTLVESLELRSDQASSSSQSTPMDQTSMPVAIDQDLPTEESESSAAHQQASLNIVRQAIDWVAESVPRPDADIEPLSSAELQSSDMTSLVESVNAIDTNAGESRAAGVADVAEQYLEIATPVVVPEQNLFAESATPGRHSTEDTIDISIGAINVVVEAPARTSSHSATASAQSGHQSGLQPGHQPRQNGSRLHRRYLR